ncbi:MAG: 30S ribosomal protein S21 [Planctomycetota bacterium]|nr:MAG: 30S ribosomal protein S21 [Planctomycetota bacterium]
MTIKITVRDNDSLETVLKRFKRICDKEGIKKALRQYSYYEKPSERRRRKQKERLRNIRKQLKAKNKARTKALARAKVRAKANARKALALDGGGETAAASTSAES